MKKIIPFVLVMLAFGFYVYIGQQPVTSPHANFFTQLMQGVHSVSNVQQNNSASEEKMVKTVTVEKSDPNASDKWQVLRINADSPLYETPDQSGKVLETLPEGSRVEAFENKIINDTPWSHVQTINYKGWILGSNVEDYSSYVVSHPVQTQQTNHSDNVNTVDMPQPSTTKTTNPTVQPKSNTTPAPVNKTATNQYPVTPIQTYTISIEDGNIVVTGSKTAYGVAHHALGIILNIQESRANVNATVKVPFDDKVDYKYPLTYPYGEVVVNLDQYYQDVPDDPNKVLGSAVYTLKDVNPYLTPSYMVQSDDSTIKNLASSITSNQLTESDKAQAIFQWVAQNVRYDVQAYNNLDQNGTGKNYSALDTLKTRLAMCTGYANLNASLLRAVGIQTKVVYGENHAWNEVYLNGDWQIEDPTFGSGYLDTSTNQFVSQYQPQYFTKSDKHKEGELNW